MFATENLVRALGSFMEDMWIPLEDSYGLIDQDVKNSMIDQLKLKAEFKACVEDPGFDWIKLASDAQLLISPNDYSNLEICNYVKSLLQDYLYPEHTMSETDIQKLYVDIINILKDFSDSEGWMGSYPLYEILISNKEYMDFDYYNLWKLDFARDIERKPIPGKDREIGYLRYKVN